MPENIEQRHRTVLVRDYGFGEVSSYELEYLDKPVYATIEFNDSGNIIHEDYTELEKYIEKEFIPKSVVKKSKKDKETKEITEYLSIQLGDILKLRISELEMKYVFQYLEKKNIRIAGFSPDVESDNYDYVRTYKSSELPSYDKNFNNEEKIAEYQRTGDKDLFDKIIKNNIRLAVYVSHIYAIHTGHDINEIQSFAFEGLMYAVRNFKNTNGYKFSTYAFPCIRGYILRGLPELDFIFHRKDLYKKFILYKEAIEEQTGENVFENQKILDRIYMLMYENGEVSESEMETLKSMLRFSNPKLDELGFDLEDDYNLEIEVLTKIGREKTLELLDCLDDRERFIIEQRFGLKENEPKSLEAIGKMIDRTKTTVSFLEKRALRRLRYQANRYPYRHLDDFIDLDSQKGSKYI